MTEKRFQYNVNKNTIEQDGKFVAYVNSVDGVRIANKLNVFQKENEELKSRVEYLERKIDRERTSYQKQHKKWEEEIQKENEQLKKEIEAFKNKLCELGISDVENYDTGLKEWLE